jgi:hypothetical protein
MRYLISKKRPELGPHFALLDSKIGDKIFSPYTIIVWDKYTKAYFKSLLLPSGTRD